MAMTHLVGTLTLLASLVLGGCSTNYVTPAKGVSLAGIDNGDIKALFEKEAAAQFPANIALARVESLPQAEGFRLVTTRDIESQADLDSLTELPMVDSAAPLSRLLLPDEGQTLKDLRLAAAHLKADMLLVYTVDTTFYVDSTPLGPLTMVSLGFLPNHQAHVTATVSGILIDVRSGYVYGASEASATEEQRSSVWSTTDAVTESRKRAESAAFHGFAGDFGNFWKGVVKRYAKG